MSVIPWVGVRRIAIVPVLNRQVDQEPPPDWEYQIQSRVFYDPDPVSGFDRSFQHYLQVNSYGRALLEGEVFPRVWAENAEVNIPAMLSLPSGHGYTNLLAVLPHQFGNDRGGHAFGELPPVNGITGWARVAMYINQFMVVRQPIGVWAQELCHLLCSYWTHPSLRGYDFMDGNGADNNVHASANTKRLFGWLPKGIVNLIDGTLNFNLHAIGMIQPPPFDRVTAVQIPSQLSSNQFIVEARLQVDSLDSGIPKDAVLVYEVDDNDNVMQRGLLIPEIPELITYVNQSEGIQVTINEKLSGGFAVTIGKSLRSLVDLSGQLGSSDAAGPPTVGVMPGRDMYSITYLDTARQIQELWRTTQGVAGTRNITREAGLRGTQNNPFAYVDTNRNKIILLYRTSYGSVRSLYWSSAPIGFSNLTAIASGAPRAAGDPIGYYQADADIHHVIYRSNNGHLHELWSFGDTSSVAYGGDLTVLASKFGPAPASMGQPSAYIDRSSTNNVIYRSSDGHIWRLYWTTGEVMAEDLSGTADAPWAAGDPFAYYTPHNDTHQIYFIASDGHLWELYWQGNASVGGWKVTAKLPLAAAFLPAAYYHARTNTKHVIHRTIDGQLHEIWWVPGQEPFYRNLAVSYGAPLSADPPVAFTVQEDNSQHVVYRGIDNHIYEIRWL